MSKKKIIFKYLKKHLLLLFLILLFAIVFTVFKLLIPILFGKIIDEFFISKNYIEKISKYFIFISIFVCSSFLFEYLFELLSSIFVQNFVKNIRDDLYEKYNLIPISELDKRYKGDLLLREVSDIENISNGLLSTFKQLYKGIISIIIIICIIFYLNYLLALVIVLITPLSIWISYFIGHKCNKYFKLQSNQNGLMSSYSLESLNNFIITNSFNYQKESYNHFKKINFELYKVGQKAQFYSSLINPTTRLLNNITYFLIILIGSFIIIYSKTFSYIGLSLTIGVLQSLLYYANSYAKPFNDISSTITELQNANASFNRIIEIININNEENFGSKKITDISSINLKNLSFAYNNDKYVLNNISLNIKKGQKIAIIGKTGCGKTTLINLLMNFYKLNNGEILIDNNNLYDLDIKEFRNNIGMVLQDTWIFNGTIKDNISFGNKNASFEDIIQASKQAQAYNFITSLKDGFDTYINENSGLSIGEMQLICIARVILKKSNLIILDEATSNVDALTEEKITKAFIQLLKEKTSIVIAHRLSTIKNSDLIIVLDNGIIVEQGNHDVLMKKKGYYYSLYTSRNV